MDCAGCLAAVINDHWGLATKEPEHISAVERDSECIKELLCHPNKPQCIFDDMNSFWAPAVKTQLEKLGTFGKTLDFETLLPVIRSPKSVSLTATCRVHKKQCKLVRGKLSIQGTPCWDYSPMGPQTGLAGRTMVVQAAWAAVAFLGRHQEPSAKRIHTLHIHIQSHSVTLLYQACIASNSSNTLHAHTHTQCTTTYVVCGKQAGKQSSIV